MSSTTDRDSFLQRLSSFKVARGEDVEPPTFAKRSVDQFKLWVLVQEAGGHCEVTTKKGWARIGRFFEPPKTMTDLSFRIKKLYEGCLLPFEKAILNGEVNGIKPPERKSQLTEASKHTAAKQSKTLKQDKRTNESVRAPKRVLEESRSREHGLVGKRIRVLWPEEGQFFSGFVSHYNSKTGWHRIDYDDGDEEQLDLASETWHLVTPERGAKQSGELTLLDNGGLGQLHSAAQALAGLPSLRGFEATTYLPPAERLDDSNQGACVLQGDGFKVFDTRKPEGFEVFCLVPGLQLEEIRVLCWDSGKLLIIGEPQDPVSSSHWGIQSLRMRMRLPKSVQAKTAKALVTLHGQLYIQVLCQPQLATNDARHRATHTNRTTNENHIPQTEAESRPAGPCLNSAVHVADKSSDKPANTMQESGEGLPAGKTVHDVRQECIAQEKRT